MLVGVEVAVEVEVDLEPFASTFFYLLLTRDQLHNALHPSSIEGYLLQEQRNRGTQAFPFLSFPSLSFPFLSFPSLSFPFLSSGTEGHKPLLLFKMMKRLIANDLPSTFVN